MAGGDRWKRSMGGDNSDGDFNNCTGMRKKEMATRVDHDTLYQDILRRSASWNVLTNEEMEKLKRTVEMNAAKKDGRDIVELAIRRRANVGKNTRKGI